MGKASNGNSTTSSATASEVVKSSWMTKRSQLKSRFSFTNYREEEESGVLDCQLTFGRSTSSEFPKLIMFPA